MKKLFKTMFVLAALSASMVFTSCGDDGDGDGNGGTVESAAPTLTVNDGVTAMNGSLSLDTVFVKCVVSADTDRKIKKLTVTRAIAGQSTNTIYDGTYDAKDVVKTHKDVIAGEVNVDEDDVITYTVKATDDKGKTAEKSFTVTIKTMATSPQILLGGPDNNTNLDRFFGTADGFRKYTAGPGGANAARDNSSKVDFLFFYNPSGTVFNAIYSPDYAFAAGSGWNSETTTWPTKNKTLYKLTDINSSVFDALQGSTFMTELNGIDFTTGMLDRLAMLESQKVIAYIKADGKRGLILIVNKAAASTGNIVLVVKSEL
ncbi:MAG: hypothetical protein KA981_06870 [Bacteroidia bacterium]|jgi:hypothetical protein|nr:hypothetical protein [Bacteroidia bacterium]